MNQLVPLSNVEELVGHVRQGATILVNVSISSDQCEFELGGFTLAEVNLPIVLGLNIESAPSFKDDLVKELTSSIEVSATCDTERSVKEAEEATGALSYLLRSWLDNDRTNFSGSIHSSPSRKHNVMSLEISTASKRN